MKVIKMSSVPKEAAPMTGGLMTGTQVWRQGIFEEGDSNNFNFGVVSFDAGSRNKFHKHSGDQILIVTSGTGKVATDNEVITVTEGDVIIIPAQENHWHGESNGTDSLAHVETVHCRIAEFYVEDDQVGARVFSLENGFSAIDGFYTIKTTIF